MTTDHQEQVTSCLLARVNARGAVVPIAMFGPYAGFNRGTSTELSTYAVTEAAFYGNVFLSSPKAFICTAQYANTPACADRACLHADGTCDCGIISEPSGTFSLSSMTVSVAQCETTTSLLGTKPGICSQATHFGTNGVYYTNCSGGARTWSNVVTTRVKLQSSGGPCYGDWECLGGACTSSSTCK